MRNNTKKGAAQDVKFDTTAHDYGKRAAKMTKQERSDYREGGKIALSFTPVTPVLGLIAKIASKLKLGKNVGIGYGKGTKVVEELHNTPSHPLNPLSTPLTPKFTPKNPRPMDVTTWKGGRKVKTRW